MNFLVTFKLVGNLHTVTHEMVINVVEKDNMTFDFYHSGYLITSMEVTPYGNKFTPYWEYIFEIFGDTSEGHEFNDAIERQINSMSW